MLALSGSSDFCIGKKGARVVLLQRVEFHFIHRRFDRHRAADIDAERTDVDARYLLTDEEDSLSRQQQFFVQFVDLRIELSECKGQPRGKHFQRCNYFAKSPACHHVSQHHDQPMRLFDGRKGMYSYADSPTNDHYSRPAQMPGTTPS